MQSLSELRLHTISIDCSATPCTAHFAIQPSLTEFRTRGLVINMEIRFIAPILVKFVSACTPCLALHFSEGSLVTLFGDLEVYCLGFSRLTESLPSSLPTARFFLYVLVGGSLQRDFPSSKILVHCSGYSKTKHDKK